MSIMFYNSIIRPVMSYWGDRHAWDGLNNWNDWDYQDYQDDKDDKVDWG